MVEETERPRFTHLAFPEHDQTQLYPLRLHKLVLALGFVHNAGEAIENILHIFFFFGASERISLPIGA